MRVLPPQSTLAMGGWGRGADRSHATTWWPRPGSRLSAEAAGAQEQEGETGMPRRMITLLGLRLTSSFISVTAAGQDPVYTVPQVLAGLARDPRAWSGRAT